MWPQQFFVSIQGASGLVVGWKDDIQMSIKDQDKFFIYMQIEDQARMLLWDVMAFHLNNDKRIRDVQYVKVLDLVT